MLKAPVPGEVKTRLGREIGFEAAAAACRRLVEHQIRQLPRGWPLRVCYAPAEAGAAMRHWLGEIPEYSPQSAGDLGGRLEAAMTHQFTHRDAPLCFIGGDCPGLLSAHFLEVAERLAANDAVIVPALDGGYVAIALRRACPAVFRGIAWSTGAVLDQTRERLRAAEMTWFELPALEDVDDAASWQRALAAFPDLREPHQSFPARGKSMEST